jgi:uncharacterized membrane protein YuzA (DUF378 family)
MKFDANTRLWIYRVSGALMPLLVTLGAFNNNVAGRILDVVAALVGVGAAGLAANNVVK